MITVHTRINGVEEIIERLTVTPRHLIRALVTKGSHAGQLSRRGTQHEIWIEIDGTPAHPDVYRLREPGFYVAGYCTTRAKATRLLERLRTGYYAAEQVMARSQRDYPDWVYEMDRQPRP